MSGRKRRKYGIALLILGLLCALLLGAARDSIRSAQQDIKPEEDGTKEDLWVSVDTMDFLIGLGWLEVVVGAVMAIWPVKGNAERKEKPRTLENMRR